MFKPVTRNRSFYLNEVLHLKNRFCERILIFNLKDKRKSIVKISTRLVKKNHKECFERNERTVHSSFTSRNCTDRPQIILPIIVMYIQINIHARYLFYWK